MVLLCESFRTVICVYWASLMMTLCRLLMDPVMSSMWPMSASLLGCIYVSGGGSHHVLKHLNRRIEEGIILLKIS